MTLQELQKLYTQNNLGQFKVYQDPARIGGQKYLYIPNAGYYAIDDASLSQLDQNSLIQAGSTLLDLGGGRTQAAFSDAIAGKIVNGVSTQGRTLDQIYGAFQNQVAMNKQVSDAAALNNAIKSGDTATVERLSPGYTLWNGAFVQKSSIPQLEKEGATVQGGNVVGAPIKTATPPSGTETSGSGTSLASMGQTTDTSGYTRDPQGNVYDAQGKYVTYESLPKDASGNPVMNLETLPVGPYTGGAQTSAGVSTGQQGSTGTTFDPTSVGISWDQYNSLNPLAQATVQQLWIQAQAAYQKGQIDYSLNAKALQDALTAATNDPNIQAKYGDYLQIAKGNLTQGLATLNADFAQSQGLLQTQQQLERKQLAEQEALAGRAQSGFRQKATQQLAQSQSGVIASSQRQLQQNLQTLGQGLEQTYGTSGMSQFGPIAAGGMSYTPYNNLTGTIEAQKKADIEARQQQIYNIEKPIA